MKKFKVRKKDGSLVDFEPKKIHDACISAGASEDLAIKVLDSVMKDIYIIDSTRIREIILKNLREFDNDIADNWIKYDIEHGQVKNNRILKL